MLLHFRRQHTAPPEQPGKGKHFYYKHVAPLEQTAGT